MREPRIMTLASEQDKGKNPSLSSVTKSPLEKAVIFLGLFLTENTQYLFHQYPNL